MYIATLFVLLFAVAGVLFIVRNRQTGIGVISADSFMVQHRSPQTADSRPAVQRQDFRATSIHCGSGACEKARQLEGRRGLVSQIPRLPLSTCDADVCMCTYKHHADRRDDDDRRAILGSVAAAKRDAADNRRG